MPSPLRLVGLLLWTFVHDTMGRPAEIGCTLRRASNDGESGEEIGYVRFTEHLSRANFSHVEVRITNGRQVTHSRIRALHVHANGKTTDFCNDAGGHWNPDNLPHACPSTTRHAGDIGNVEMGQAEVTAWQIFDNDNIRTHFSELPGHVVVFHSDRDDCVTQPTGNAGGRMACCVLVLEGDEPLGCNYPPSFDQVGGYTTYPSVIPASGEFELTIVGACLSSADSYGVANNPDASCASVQMYKVNETWVSSNRAIVTIPGLKASSNFTVCYSIGGLPARAIAVHEGTPTVTTTPGETVEMFEPGPPVWKYWWIILLVCLVIFMALSSWCLVQHYKNKRRTGKHRTILRQDNPMERDDLAPVPSGRFLSLVSTGNGAGRPTSGGSGMNHTDSSTDENAKEDRDRYEKEDKYGKRPAYKSNGQEGTGSSTSGITEDIDEIIP